jgi:L-iditol 2-dehydrogenase
MKALVHTEAFQLEYMDVPDPEPGPDDVVVRVQAVGICGSDVQGYTGGTGRRIPPIIMGHEAAGVIDRVGDGVVGLQVGEPVCFDSTIYCNRCEACGRGEYNRCAQRHVLGVSIPGMKRQGAMAELVSVPSWTVIRMPESLSFTEAALLEPVSIGAHAVNRGKVEQGATVLVIGAGTIGLFVVQAARLKRAGTVIVSDLDPGRRALALSLGADLAVDPTREGLIETVREATGGKGADVVFEVVGIPDTVQQSVSAARTGGTVVLVGNLTKLVKLDVQEVVSKELSIRGSYASSGEYRACMDLVASGQVQVMPLVSEVLPLSEGQRAFDRLYQAEAGLIKIVLNPQQVAAV